MVVTLENPMPGNFFPPPPLVAAVLAVIILWLVELQAFYWPLPVDRNRHAFVNIVGGILSLTLLGILTAAIVKLSFEIRFVPLGLLNWLRLPLFFETVLGLALYDLANYWVHRSQHMIPALWKIHRAHHTDVYIDVTTSLRFHPFESIYRGVFLTAAVLLLGISPYSMLAYGVLVAFTLPLSHANLAIPARWESWSQYGIVLPLQHRIHHSQSRAEHDSNYAIVFLWWDHLFGTYLSPTKVANLKTGLPGVSTERSGSVRQILKEPFLS